MRLFGKSRTWQSVIFNDVVTHLITRYEEKLHWDTQRLTYQQLQSYAEYVGAHGRGASIWGFVDGTLKMICRPSRGQRSWYSGYKKHHAIKFQAITTLDGLISHLAGPFEDWAAWKQSAIENHFRQTHQGLLERQEARARLYVYGDLTYSAGYGVMGPYNALPGRPLPPETQAFNAYMSSLRNTALANYPLCGRLLHTLELWK